VFHLQPEDCRYQVPKHVVVSYVENTLYSTKKYNCVRRIHTLSALATYIKFESGGALLTNVSLFSCTFLIAVNSYRQLMALVLFAHGL